MEGWGGVRARRGRSKGRDEGSDGGLKAEEEGRGLRCGVRERRWPREAGAVEGGALAGLRAQVRV